MIREKDKEIESLRKEVEKLKGESNERNNDKKPNFRPGISRDVKFNDNFIITNNKCSSTSNKSNPKSVFKFDTKKNKLNEKVQLFSNRGPNIKKMNKFNNFNNNLQNNSISNRNSLTSRYLTDIIYNFGNLNDNLKSTKFNSNLNSNINSNLNSLSNSTNFNSIKNNGRSNSSINKNDKKNFSSTFSDFFRKSNKKNNNAHNLNSYLRDGNKCKNRFVANNIKITLRSFLFI